MSVNVKSNKVGNQATLPLSQPVFISEPVLVVRASLPDRTHPPILKLEGTRQAQFRTLFCKMRLRILIVWKVLSIPTVKTKLLFKHSEELVEKVLIVLHFKALFPIPCTQTCSSMSV